MMLAFVRNGHGVGAADAHGFWCAMAWLLVRNGHGVRATDAHDAGSWYGMAMGQGQLMLMMLAFGAEWAWGKGS